MDSPVDPNDRMVSLKGFPLSVIIISAIFFVVSAVTVAFRSLSRIQSRVFGWDDGLMAAGTVRNPIVFTHMWLSDKHYHRLYIVPSLVQVYTLA